MGAQVVPVHPTKSTIMGTPGFPSVADIPFDIDLAVVLVRDPLPVIEECVAKGVKVAVVFAAGFEEVGTVEGRRRHRRLARLATGPMRILGPNTNLNVLERWRRDLVGKRLAILTQSGFQGRPIAQSEALGVPIQSWVTLGNEVDLDFADMVAEFAAWPDTGAIAGYVEGFRDGHTFMLAADEAARAQVPIVLIKIGRTDEGRKAAAAHTAHITGSDEVHDAVFAQTGVVRVDDLDEVIEVSGMFCHVGRPLELKARGGVGIYALSGGTASHMADMCAAAGLHLPRLTRDTIHELYRHIPWYLRVDNPVDSGGAINASPAGRATLELLAGDPRVDLVIAPITGVFPGMSDTMAADLIALHRRWLDPNEVGPRKPVLVVWSSPVRDDSAYRSLCEAGVPLFHSFGTCVRGAKALIDWSRFVSRYRSPFAAVRAAPAGAAIEAREVLDSVGPGALLHEVAAKGLLASYGIPIVEEYLAQTADEAVKVAATMGPVAMKIVSAAIPHKSELDLVALGVEGRAAVRRAFSQLLARAQAARPDAVVDGVVVQRMINDGVAEVIVGIAHQPPFGPTIVAGLGGIFVEVLRDVAFGVPPFTRHHATSMITGLRGWPLLNGARGRPRADVPALVDTIMRLQTLAVDLGDEIISLDVNPLVVRPLGHGVAAVDALAIKAR
jgi:acyl-CoA synthetase (NDP forming)